MAKKIDKTWFDAQLAQLGKAYDNCENTPDALAAILRGVYLKGVADGAREAIISGSSVHSVGSPGAAPVVSNGSGPNVMAGE